ncbi:mitochondrial PGP phosphatase-domain-containing protein [Cokeromyces recurvatus]|uniref:mitochondrial PGP phosphatase-domain-containing protein n=1 Tax=Cokeromyces recurvatus TaxID=90255 RepID=UPI00221FA8F1|nr:mitochondrial PGP phosphatase-domain-containing protein [Cokeromyces recurvatus]KAI7898666.1 mitochondrial PGP phosphatase-domain-containing protein [Cokeromyces recurvatus]
MVQSLNLSGIVNAFRLLWNPSLAMPHIIVDDIRHIQFSNLKKIGNIKAIGFDKDNCLTAPYVSTINPPFKNAWDNCIKTFSKENVIIVSNSAGTEDDIDYKDNPFPPLFLLLSIQAQHLEKSLGVSVLRHKEKKPSGGQYLTNYFSPISSSQIAFVGDRILTDIVYGNCNGNLTIWTKKIITEEGDNKMALMIRRFEYRLISFLQKMNVKAPPHHSISIDKNYTIPVK